MSQILPLAMQAAPDADGSNAAKKGGNGARKQLDEDSIVVSNEDPTEVLTLQVGFPTAALLLLLPR